MTDNTPPRRSSSQPGALPLILALCLLCAGSACPERSAAPPAPAPPCTAFGQRCEFSPGKLGSCVQRDNCSGNDCFICQSQH